DLLGRAFRARGFLADVPVLAEDTAQVAQAEEDGARALGAAQAVFLTKVWKGSRDVGEAASVADARLAGHAVDMAVPRGAAAVFQHDLAGGRSFGQQPRAVECRVGGLERVKDESVIEPRRRGGRDHGSQLQSESGCAASDTGLTPHGAGVW